MRATQAPAFPVHGVAPDVELPADAGGKARGLARIESAGLRTAPWFVVGAAAHPSAPAPVPDGLPSAVDAACRELRRLGADRFAVRSSALDEDGGTHSFAGQYLTVLDVADSAGVLDAIERCRAAADAPSVRAYRTALGLPPGSPGIAVIVQAMVPAAWAGIAFSEPPCVTSDDGAPGSSARGGDPDGRHDRLHAAGPGPEPPAVEPEAVVVATRGLGVPLVSGTVDGGEYRVSPAGAVVAVRPDPAGSSLAPGVVREVADAARLLARLDGRPQDIEWAIAPDGRLYVLQARPITSCAPRIPAAAAGPEVRRASDAAAPAPVHAAAGPRADRVTEGATPRILQAGAAGTGSEPRVRLWDNANIVESFPGVTLPLTYSVAREAYADVYRSACRSLGVAESTIREQADVFEQLLGHVDGRVYYNVSCWHRILAMLPGFGASSGLLERMMGAGRPGSRAGERAAAVAASAIRPRDLARVAARSAVGVAFFERRARAFESRIRDLACAERACDLDALSVEQLLDRYDAARARALAGWHVTIFNDLAVMVAHGALRRAAEAWLRPGREMVVDRLLQSGALASTEPARALRAIARELRAHPAWSDALDLAPDPLGLLRTDPALGELRALVDGYLGRWGDRCPSELQLDRPTFRDEPAPLLAAIRALAATPDALPAVPGADDRGRAWAELRAALLPAPAPVRVARERALHVLVDVTRDRLAWRERMRFARTEVFAIGRRLFAAMDRRLWTAGVLDAPGDLHYLDVGEIRGAIRGTLPPVELRTLASERRRLFVRLSASPDPPPRFETTGPVLLGTRPAPARVSGPGGELCGTPVWGGVVRARCLRIEDPRSVAPRAGEIVVARATDPGWVPFLVAAAGLLVERGSLLSHSAIVARELGLPTIVGIAGLCDAVAPGQIAEMDGARGTVRLERAGASPALTHGAAQ